MKSILSVLMTAVLLLSALTACGSNRSTGKVEEARVTSSPAAQATKNPMNTPAATNEPGEMNRNDTAGNAVGNAAGNVGEAAGAVAGGAGRAVGDVVNGVGNAVGDAANGVGNAVNDLTDDMRTGDDGRVMDGDGVIGNERG